MADKLGVCPVPAAMKYDGQNDGIGAGRVCWVVPNSACQKNRLTRQINSCFECTFYKRVVFEEEENVLFKFSSVKV